MRNKRGGIGKLIPFAIAIGIVVAVAVAYGPGA